MDMRSQELSKEELSKLLFKKMMVQPSQVAKIDTFAFGKIHMELNENVKPEKFMNFLVFDIREEIDFPYEIISMSWHVSMELVVYKYLLGLWT